MNITNHATSSIHLNQPQREVPEEPPAQIPRILTHHVSYLHSVLSAGFLEKITCCLDSESAKALNTSNKIISRYIKDPTRSVTVSLSVKCFKGTIMQVLSFYPALKSVNLKCDPTLSAPLSSFVRGNFPLRVTSLSLDFSTCTQLDTATLQQLVDNVPQNLTSLILKIENCRNLNDALLEGLAQNLPNSLQSLEIDVSTCRKLTNAVPGYFAERAPQLSSFTLKLTTRYLPVTETRQPYPFVQWAPAGARQQLNF